MRRQILAITAALFVALSLPAAALAAANHRTVQILDNCDGPSFNAFLGPGACARPSGITAATFFQQLSKGGAASWRFAPEQLKLAAGGTVTAVNRGGEFHTFTAVAAFGGGCVAELNGPLGLTPVAECAGAPGIFGTTGVAPGTSLTTAPLAPGTHRFQCLIHPWQRTTATVR
jgi:plastocyanin